MRSELLATTHDDSTLDKLERSIIRSYEDKTLELSFVERNLKFATLFGFGFEKKLWSLIHHQEKGLKLNRSYDIYCDRESYMKQEEEKCKIHLNRATDKKSRSLVTARLLCLGQLEPTVKLLLETEPTEENFLADQLLACLISTTSNSG